MKINDLPPKERTIIPPISGWKERTYYKVLVSFHKGNPIHQAIFYTGFLNGRNGGPGGYSKAWNPTWDVPLRHGDHEIGDFHFMQAMQELFGHDEAIDAERAARMKAVTT